MIVPSRFLIVAALLAFIEACAPPRSTSGDDPAFGARRMTMVRVIEEAGVRDSITLAAMRTVPRHEFVLPRDSARAYDDEALPIGLDQTISQPYIVAFMTQALRPRPGLKVLEVGTGSGYQAAVLAQTGCKVYTIEIIRALADSARARLARLGYTGIEVRHGDGYRGWPEVAPFDAIMLTAAPEQIPQELVRQLAPGGRLVAPVGAQHRPQKLVLLEKDRSGHVRRSELLPVWFVPMRRGLR